MTLPAHALRFLQAVLLGALLVALGCDGGEPAADAGLQPGQAALYAELRAQADAILAASLAPPQQVALPAPGRWRFLDALSLPAPGEAVELPEGRVPLDVAVADDGTVLVALADRLRVARPGEPATDLGEWPGARLQWDATGGRLAVSTPERKGVLSWPGLESGREVPAVARGRLLFAPDGEGLWIVEEDVNFSANTEVRLRWRVWTVTDEGTLERLRPQPGTLFTASALGTLPALGVAWGQRALPYQLAPVPGPLFALNDATAPGEALTATADSIDLMPSATRGGEIVFVRAPRAVHGLGRGARAWATDTAKGAGSARPLTAEPTYLASVAPGGEWVALLVARDGKPTVLRARREALGGPKVEAAQAARDELLASARAVQQDVEARFAALGMQDAIVETELGPVLSRAYAPGLPEALGEALRESLAERLGEPVPEGIAALGWLDSLVAELDGAWPEAPPMVLAIAGLHAGALPGSLQATWTPVLEDSEMAAGLGEATRRSDRHGLYTLHSPLFAAREALAGQARLDALARELATEHVAPVGLVDAFTAEAEAGFLAALMGQTAASFPGAPLEVLQRAMRENPDAPMLAMLVWDRARSEGDLAAETQAILLLAAARPRNPWVLLEAARAVESYGELEASGALNARAAELTDEPSELLRAADGLRLAGREDDARAVLGRVVGRARVDPRDGSKIPVEDSYTAAAREVLAAMDSTHEGTTP